jgi:5-(carboxyamino)imidazole ribonucleotide mutase
MNNEIAIIIGSDSDLPIIKKATDVLSNFSVEYKLFIASAHRTPKFLDEIIKKCENNNVKVYISAAGGAAHLPGVIASKTNKPVIGVPISLENSTLNGVDSLYSIVQMPSSIPVATVGINSGVNAALLALEILALNNDIIRKNIKKYKHELAEKVIQKNKGL